MNSHEKLESLLRTIVETIGKRTPSPVIRHLGNDALFHLQVDGKDQGRFVGKNGAHIWAIQTLFWYAGLAQCGYVYNLKLLEPEVPNKERVVTPFRFREDWDREKIKKLYSSIILTCTPCHASCNIREENETTAVVQLRIIKYLERNMEEPSFVEAFSTVLRIAGMSQGANIKTEAIFS